MSTPQEDPRFVFVMGDVHGNLQWTLHALDEADKLFTRASESRRIVIQLGDFGFRPVSDNADLAALNRVLIGYGMELWFIDGNHDFHPDLIRLTEFAHQFDDMKPPGVVAFTLPGFSRVRYLPRGTRWTWHGRTWLAVGGAASVDRLARTEGVDWWPEEEITPEQETDIVAAGPADVLLSHDCPDIWMPWDKMIPRGQLPPIWIPELPRARAHSVRLERIARGAEVSRVFHGHYHILRDDDYADPVLGRVRVTGLDMNGSPRNYQLIDVEAVCGSDR